jgi:hypothetical protein
MGVPVKTGGEKSWELVPASSCEPEGQGGATEGVGGLEGLETVIFANCFRLAAHSAEPRLPSLREGERGDGDGGGEDIVEKSMVVVRSQEGLTQIDLFHSLDRQNSPLLLPLFLLPS